MATTTFNTRISLKYDTYAQWVEKDPQLLVGEVAVVVVPAETGAVAKEPAVLFKVGDGAHKFSELQFTAGLAADVYDWQKQLPSPPIPQTRLMVCPTTSQARFRILIPSTSWRSMRTIAASSTCILRQRVHLLGIW